MIDPDIEPGSVPTAGSWHPRFFALIPCAGAGLRAGGELPKQYQTVAGKPMVWHTLQAFASVPRIVTTLLVVSPEDAHADALFGLKNLEDATSAASVWIQRCGGATRAQTVANGLQALRNAGCQDDDWVLVHDAARCLISPKQINALIGACADDAVGGLLACPVADTLKAERDGRVITTVERAGKWSAQTPQMFQLDALCTALKQALADGVAVTDEASALERLGHLPKLVQSSSQNFKITYREDFALAEAILLSRRNLSMTAPVSNASSSVLTQDAFGADQALYAAPVHTQKPPVLPNFRVGEGWDIHRLAPGRPLILGGVHIPYEQGLLGHSDADALCHAITDALLGAAALGDIGQHFPDTDPRYKGADSVQLLGHAAALVRSQGWHILNVDSTVITQAPKLAPHRDAMRHRLSAALGVDIAQVNVKAKTAEKLGPVGEGLAMEARAVVMLFKP